MSNVNRKSFSYEVIEAVWAKGDPVQGHSVNMYRLDAFGHVMQKGAYGDQNSKYGWEIDHIVPISRGGSNSINNLQPLYWENNRDKADMTMNEFIRRRRTA